MAQKNKGQRGNISDQQLIEEGMQLLDGTRDARTDSERELRDSLMDMYDRRIKLGDDEEDGLENTKKAMQAILDKERSNAQNSREDNGQRGRANSQTPQSQGGGRPETAPIIPDEGSKKPNRYTVPSGSKDATTDNTAETVTVQPREDKAHSSPSRERTEVSTPDESPTPIEGEQTINMKDQRATRGETEPEATSTSKNTERKTSSKPSTREKTSKTEAREENNINEGNSSAPKGDN